MESGWDSERLPVVVLHLHLFKILSLEDLAAIETFHVVHAVLAGNYGSVVVVASGLHKQRLDGKYFSWAPAEVKT